MFGARIVEDAMSDNNELKAYLHNHPKTLSALFGLTVLLSQVGSAAAQFSVIRGP
jgi:hypothetical protein